jgi:CRISPR-associated protein Cmr4
MTTTRLLAVHARSPLHVGTGQSTASVDLPIARDRATRLPLVPGSSLKGALRARARTSLPDREVIVLFGPETENARDHAGSLVFTDSRLLLLPVRSVAGTFAWVTCPLAVAQLRRDAALVKLAFPAPAPKGDEWGSVSEGSSFLEVRALKKIVLEEVDLHVDPSKDVRALAEALGQLLFPEDEGWRDMLVRRLVVVSDDLFTFFARYATDVVTRVSIDPETGTARDGQLWTEENLPPESVLVGLVEEVPTGTRRGAAGAHLATLASLLAAPVQLGGKATVGRGRCQLVLGGA